MFCVWKVEFLREISSWQRVGNCNQVVVKTLAPDINQRSKTTLQFILSGELWQELLEHFHISWQNMTSWHDIFSVKHDQFDILISSLKIRHRWQIARQDDRFLNISYREKLNHFHEPNNTIIATKIQIYNPPPTPPYKLEWKPPIYLFHNVMSGQESPVWMWHDYQCYLPQLMFDTRWSMIPGAEKQKRGERGDHNSCLVSQHSHEKTAGLSQPGMSSRTDFCNY